MRSLGKTLLAFALLHSILQGQICLLLQVFLIKGVRQGCILSPCLFNLYAEYIMRKAGLEEAQAGIKTVGRNINNLRYEMTPLLWQKVKMNQKAS